MRAVRRGDARLLTADVLGGSCFSDGRGIISGSAVGNHPLLTGDDKRRVNWR